ncbi:MAG: TetR family transcriptional regulator [Solirubrobacteraceae bacterium]
MGTRPPYQTSSRQLLTVTLLDAARELLRERTWAQVTMAEVARAAGVSRQTLYGAFGSRSEFAQALVLREGDRFLTAVEEALRSGESAADALNAAVSVFMHAAIDDPFVRSVLAGAGGGPLLELVTVRGGPLVQGASERIAAALRARWRGLPAPEAQLFAECLVRLAISFASLPPEHQDPTAFGAVLVPYLERLVDGSAAEPR